MASRSTEYRHFEAVCYRTLLKDHTPNQHPIHRNGDLDSDETELGRSVH